jgi:thioredoxin 1
MCVPWSVLWPFVILILTRFYEIFFPKSKASEPKKEVEPSGCCATIEPEHKTAFYLTENMDWKKMISAKKKTFAKFTAKWCKPCKELNPLFTEISEANYSKATFVNVDVDEFDAIAAENGALSIPLIVCFENGKAVASLSGKDELKVKKFFDDHL